MSTSPHLKLNVLLANGNVGAIELPVSAAPFRQEKIVYTHGSWKLRLVYQEACVLVDNVRWCVASVEVLRDFAVIKSSLSPSSLLPNELASSDEVKKILALHGQSSAGPLALVNKALAHQTTSDDLAAMADAAHKLKASLEQHGLIF